MTASVIGALRVNLGLDSAQFNRGARQAQGTLQQMRRTIMTVSASMGVVGVAAFAMVRDVSAAGSEIARQSRIANTSTRDFQRMAAAAATVGIEQDKLADILKDVNDRVGDFLQTGGGPMADFFENIAPQVGVTADMFRDLSGADAWQLFVSSLEKANLSQAEMTFYLEAMASDATALIPLLANSGAEIDRLGDAAEATGAIMSDEAVANSQAFRQALTRLTQGASGLKNTIAEGLMPAFTSMINYLADHVIPAISGIIGKVSEWIDAFKELPGPIQEAVGLVAAALGAGGPVLLAIGVLRGAILALVGAAGPIGLFIAAAAALSGAWVTWGDDIKAAIGPAVAFITEKFEWLLGKIQGVIEIAGVAKAALVDFFTFADERAAVVGAGSEAAMRQAGQNIGAAMTDGLVDGATSPAAINELRDYINSFPAAAEDELEIRSPSRVFRRIGQYISQGLGLGILDGAPGATDAMSEVVGGITNETQEAALALGTLEQSAQSAFRGFVTGASTATDAARSLLNSFADVFANQAFNAFFGNAFASGGLVSSLLGFENGTGYAPGGLAMVGERGPELVNLPRGSQVFDSPSTAKMLAPASSQASQVQVIGGNLTLSDNGQIMTNVQVIASQAGQQAVQQVSKSMANDPNFGMPY